MVEFWIILDGFGLKELGLDLETNCSDLTDA
jgi:hypothetical protein